MAGRILTFSDSITIFIANPNKFSRQHGAAQPDQASSKRHFNFPQRVGGRILSNPTENHCQEETKSVVVAGRICFGLIIARAREKQLPSLEVSVVCNSKVEFGELPWDCFASLNLSMVAHGHGGKDEEWPTVHKHFSPADNEHKFKKVISLDCLYLAANHFVHNDSVTLHLAIEVDIFGFDRLQKTGQITLNGSVFVVNISLLAAHSQPLSGLFDQGIFALTFDWSSGHDRLEKAFKWILALLHSPFYVNFHAITDEISFECIISLARQFEMNVVHFHLMKYLASDGCHFGVGVKQNIAKFAHHNALAAYFAGTSGAHGTNA